MNDPSSAWAVLIAVASVVLGYGVFCVIPRQHFPRTAGILAANASVAALAVAGVAAAASLLPWFLLATIFVGMVGLQADGDDRTNFLRKTLDD